MAALILRNDPKCGKVAKTVKNSFQSRAATFATRQPAGRGHKKEEEME
jgi:hypothetical protein